MIIWLKNRSKVRYRTFQLRSTPRRVVSETGRPSQRQRPTTPGARWRVGPSTWGHSAGFRSRTTVCNYARRDNGPSSCQVKRPLHTRGCTALGRRPSSARLGKLDRARSRLYRSQILQENMRRKALAEIYTMLSFALLESHIFSKICQNFAKILQNIWLNFDKKN